MRLTTDTDTLKAAITAELHAAEWATPVERKQVDKVADLIIDRLTRPEKTSDITGFPEDDEYEPTAEEFDETFGSLKNIEPQSTPLLERRRRIPGMPRDL